MAPQPSDAAQASSNPLVSKGGSSELQVILHPLVLLTISDYITRHTLREQKGAIVGGLLGQQNGREISIEHAFDVPMQEDDTVEPQRFQTRLEQMKLVHKDPQLDFVGWYTLLPSTGPDESILGVHRFFLSNSNESSLLLGFHPDEVLKHSAGGKLPLTIYESNWEVESGGAKLSEPDAEDKKMDDGEGGLQLRFRELPYSVETEETERISMNYVAAGGASAAATTTREDRPSRSVESNGKGKRRLVETEEELTKAEADEVLTRDEEEMLATLQTKANAIKMLQARIQLITTYLQRLPPSFVESGLTDDEGMGDDDKTVPYLPILRQIQALVSRLDLVVPTDKEAFDQEILQEANDVGLIELLNNVMQSVDQAKELGRKFAVIELSKTHNQIGGGFLPGPFNIAGPSEGLPINRQ